jgi:hypothetical protein
MGNPCWTWAVERVVSRTASPEVMERPGAQGALWDGDGCEPW